METIVLERTRLDAEVAALDHWRIHPSKLVFRQEVLGFGGFGIVRIGELQPSGEDHSPIVVAVKMLRSRCETMDLLVAFRLVREMKVWAGLSHRNILPFVGFHLSQALDEAMLISQRATHGSILKYIMEKKPSEAKRSHLAMQTLNGLAYLHSRNPPICHGDLKGDNILVNDLGDAMLCDFGLATILGDDSTGLTTSDGIAFKGSVRFSSPEVLDGEGKSLSSDIWSWGCLLLQILRDTIPFADVKSDVQVIKKVWGGCHPESLANLKYPLGLERILQQCWDHEINRRPNADQCYLQLLPLMKFVLGKQITCKLNHPTPRPWTDTSWTTQAQVFATLPQLVYDQTSVMSLIDDLQVLEEHLENLGMIDEASCAHSAATELLIESKQMDSSRKTYELSDYWERKTPAYEMYKYLYVLYLQAQDQRLADGQAMDHRPNSISPPPERPTECEGVGPTAPPSELVQETDVHSTSNHTCNTCDTFFAQSVPPGIPASNSMSDPSSSLPRFKEVSTPWFQNFVASMGIDDQRRRKMMRWRKVTQCPGTSGSGLYRRFFQEARPLIPERAWGIRLIKWAIKRSPQRGRATVKGICDSIRPLHKPTYDPQDPLLVSREVQVDKDLRLFVRYVLSTEPQFRFFDDAPGHYWTCTEGPGMEEDTTFEPFDLGKLLMVAQYLQQYGYPTYTYEPLPKWIGPSRKRGQLQPPPTPV
ncbi:hypothetical protein FRB95_010483 [Tulasnella sp. JGI-2019a]|nr:hypothetical protein FRB95_010483 [Tulasnella sp. JGI-2019a]